MLQAELDITLPSEEHTRSLSGWEKVRSLFGANIDDRTGLKSVVVSAAVLMDALRQALRESDVTDVIAIILNNEVLYIDHEDRDNDLEAAFHRAFDLGLADQETHRMRCVLHHRDENLEVIIDIGINSPIPVDHEELRVRITARIPELMVRAGEKAPEYTARVREFASRTAQIEAYRMLLEQFCRGLTETLHVALPNSSMKFYAPWVQLILLEPPDIARFRALEWGEDVVQPQYRPLPEKDREDGYADPYIYYYFDPYFDFLNWILLDSMHQHKSWRAPWVRVLEKGGTEVFKGDAAAEHHDELQWRSDVVRFDPHGQILVRSSMPDTDEPGDPFNQDFF